MHATFGGRVEFRGSFDAEGGATVWAAMREYDQPDPLEGAPLPPRTSGQRMADALVRICDEAISRRERVGRRTATVDVVIDVDTLVGSPPSEPRAMRCEIDGIGPVPPVVAQRLACDAAVGRVVMKGESEVLDLGRRTRVASRALRRAVVLRDRHCSFPGCFAPPDWCDVHHCTHWLEGGETSVTNCVLLCRRHHVACHEGGWRLAAGPTDRWKWFDEAARCGCGRRRSVARCSGVIPTSVGRTCRMAGWPSKSVSPRCCVPTPTGRHRSRPTARRWVRCSPSSPTRYPGLAGQLVDDAGGLHKFVNVYCNDDDIRYLDQLDTKVTDGDVISILPGGRRRLRPVLDRVPPSVMRHENILGVIGDTPLVGVHALSPNPDVRIFAKLEGQNPGGSSKDRIALKMVELAEAEGELHEGDTILEPSSGNTGIGLAMVARLRGYRLRVVMPENVSIERRQLLEIFGAEIVLSPADEGSNGAIRLSEKLGADDPSLVRLFQYGNPANPLAHYEGTGPEIWRDCPEVDVFVAGLGTSGTLMGVGRYLKEQNPAVQIVAVEPPAGELVQGLRSLDDGFVPPIFDPEILDRKFIVRPRESIEWLRRLLDDCGVFAGVSSGAAVAGAAKMAATMESGTIVTLLPDAGWKYLSSGAWTDDLDEVVERATRINYW